MTAAARDIPSNPILRSASGEPPLGADGEAFRADQGEMLAHHNPAYQSPATRIGVIELENGHWLSFPFGIDRPQFASRELALRSGVAALIRKSRRYMRNKDGEGTHWSEGYGGRVIEWALSLKLAPFGFEPAKEELTHQGATAVAVAPSGHPGLAGDDASLEAGVTDDNGGELTGAVIRNSDPIVAELVAAHRARKTYPAGHTFSMTNPIINGRMVTLGTCSCGDTFSYAWGSYERMDAAIEAHWQKFDHLPAKVDGRGFPINAEDGSDGSRQGRNSPAKKRSRRSAPKTGDTLELAKAALPEPASANASCVGGAGSSLYDEYLPIIRNTEHAAGGPPPAAPEPAPIAIGTSNGAGSFISGAQICAATTVPDGGNMGLELLPALGTAVAAGETAVGLPPHGGHGTPQAPGVAAGETAPLTDDVQTSDEFWDSPLLKAALDLAWREPPKVTDVQRALLDFGKVYALPRKVERPILRWHGGKWKLAPWIISHFPPHKVYIEPFGGAGSVLLQKLPVLTEVWNDLEGEVVNLFRVLRSSADELARLIYLTPFSREEYHSLYGICDDPVERARQFVARSFMGQSSKGALRKSGFNSRINPDGFASRLNSLRAMPEEFYAIAERFRNVIIEQKPAADIFAQYDRPDVLFYVDPPYLSDRAKHYTHELDEAGHVALLDTLCGLEGMAVVSGYRSQLYDNALTDCRRVEIEAHADGGIDRVEVVWLNPACTAALDQQMPALFDLASFDAVNTPPPLTDLAEIEQCP